MTDAASPRLPPARVRRPAWLWGGIMLTASVLPTIVVQGPSSPAGAWTRDVLFLASAVVFSR